MAANYMQKVNPNLIIALHYISKALWLVLAAVFGLIGYKLYAVGIQSVGSAAATFPLGLSFKLDNAGPGLIVIVIAFMCSLVGAVKSKVELTPEAISLTAPREDDRRVNGNGDVNAPDPGVIDRIEVLQYAWGLTEVAEFYRTPIADLVSEEEAAQVVQLQSRKPLPEAWVRDVSLVVRDSGRFGEWLRDLPTRDLPTSGREKLRLDSSLPWCVRLRWGAGVTDTVDLFVYGTATRKAV